MMAHEHAHESEPLLADARAHGSHHSYTMGNEDPTLEEAPQQRSRSRLQLNTPLVKNVGSAARDYCALERTFLSHLRLALVLFLLSISLVLRVKIPSPVDASSPTDRKLDIVAVPLGSVYAGASILATIVGWLWYMNCLKGLKKEVGFLSNPKYHEVTIIGIALLIFATALYMLAVNRASL